MFRGPIRRRRGAPRSGRGPARAVPRVARAIRLGRRPHQHHVQVSTLTDWLHNHLGVDPQTGMTPLDWLLLPQQALLEATRGQVHADHNGQLGRVRALLAWFPPQAHRWLLACQWERIAQEEAFVGRAAQAGDDLGSRLIGSSQVN
jgi:uncharacterized protein DUF4037